MILTWNIFSAWWLEMALCFEDEQTDVLELFAIADEKKMDLVWNLSTSQTAVAQVIQSNVCVKK